MNWKEFLKPTKIKIIVSLIALVVISFISTSFVGGCYFWFDCFLGTTMIYGIPAFIIVYLLLSFYENKKAFK